MNGHSSSTNAFKKCVIFVLSYFAMTFALEHCFVFLGGTVLLRCQELDDAEATHDMRLHFVV